MEIEASQFLQNVPEGRANYYGTTFLYEVGTGGLVPWDTDLNARENSVPIDEAGWLGGRTTIPYDHSDEPDNAFMQMATNISGANGQAFVEGRRVHHTNMLRNVKTPHHDRQEARQHKVHSPFPLPNRLG